MSLLKTIIISSVLCAAALPALALDGVEVLASEGHLREESFGVGSPTPAYCWWDSDPATAPLMSASNADGYGNSGCTELWSVHCDSDSLVYRGSWVPIESMAFASSHYEVDLTCSINLTSDTQLTAGRQVLGTLDTDEHTLAITHPDGTVELVLAAGSGPDEVVLVLEPGTYQIDLLVVAREFRGTSSGRHAYAGQVLLTWESQGPVPTKAKTWGATKALYRNMDLSASQAGVSAGTASLQNSPPSIVIR